MAKSLSKSVPPMCTPVNPRMSARRSLARALARDAHHREVRGAAADVGDQRDLLGLDALLIVERGGDRLELEGDLRKTCRSRRGFELALRLGVGLGIVIDKECGAAEHHTGRRRSEIFAGRRAQEAQERGNDVAEAQALAPDLGLFLEQPGAEHALDGAQITARLVCDKAIERIVAVGRRMVVEIEEQGCRHRRRTTLYGQQTRAVCVADADRGI